MGKVAGEIFSEERVSNNHKANQNVSWVLMERGCDEDICGTGSMESSDQESSIDSIESSSSSDLVEDANSSKSCSSSTSSSCFSTSPSAISNGPLYELSELMDHLPLRRGLSKCYEGKSQSFTSLASVKSLEDLPKKVAPYRRKMKPCKSYGGGLDGHKLHYPKAIISKKSSRGGSFLSSLGTFRPSIPVQKNF